MATMNWWEEHPKLWARLVPAAGQASTVQGELLRCAGKCTDEAYRNGNANWESGYERLVRFMADQLSDPTTFTSQEIASIRHAAERVIQARDSPDLSGHGSPHYLLTEMVVRWCLAHPDPISHAANPDLQI